MARIELTCLPVLLGRPSTYTLEIAEKFCDLIANGKSIGKACDEPGIPHRATIHRWLQVNAEFCDMYTKAANFRTHCLLDDARDVADQTIGDWAAGSNEDGVPAVKFSNEFFVQRKLRVDTIFRQLAVLTEKPQNRASNGDDAKVIGEEKVIEQDPLYGTLIDWEREALKRRVAKPK